MSPRSAFAKDHINISFFEALSTLGTLGAGFTLGVVVQGPPNETTIGWKPSSVTTLAALSSILFVIVVLLSQGLGQLFKFERKTIADGINEPFIRRSLAILSLTLQALVIGAFVFLELVLTAYSPKVGWTGIAITSFLAIIAFALWVGQALNRKPVNRVRKFFAKRLEQLQNISREA